MCLNLCDYQSNRRRYRKGLMYLKSRVITNLKHTIDPQKPRSKDHKLNTKESQPAAEWKRTRKRWEENQWETKFKMTINTIITLKVSGLTVPLSVPHLKDIGW